MKTASDLVGGLFVVPFLAAAGTVTLMSLGRSAEFLPPMPWANCIALLVVGGNGQRLEWEVPRPRDGCNLGPRPGICHLGRS